MLSRYVIALLLASSSLLCLAQDYIFVQLNTGDLVYYRLEDQPTITYADSKLNIQTTRQSYKRIPIQHIKNIQYAPPTNIKADDGYMIGRILVYTISGEYITMLKNIEEINTLDLPYGVYIFRTKEASKKILLN